MRLTPEIALAALPILQRECYELLDAMLLTCKPGNTSHRIITETRTTFAAARGGSHDLDDLLLDIAVANNPADRAPPRHVMVRCLAAVEHEAFGGASLERGVLRREEGQGAARQALGPEEEAHLLRVLEQRALATPGDPAAAALRARIAASMAEG